MAGDERAARGALVLLGGPGRNGAEKCGCYNVLLFSAVGSSVQFRIFILFRYRVTPTDRDAFGRRRQHSSLVSEKTNSPFPVSEP